MTDGAFVARLARFGAEPLSLAIPLVGARRQRSAADCRVHGRCSQPTGPQQGSGRRRRPREAGRRATRPEPLLVAGTRAHADTSKIDRLHVQGWFVDSGARRFAASSRNMILGNRKVAGALIPRAAFARRSNGRIFGCGRHRG